MQAQHWNDVLEYIKINLGVPLNLLEISDIDLIGFHKRQTLPYFSQFSPAQKYAMVTSANRITQTKSGNPIFAYTIPIEEGDYIIDIYDAYPSRDSAIVDSFGGILLSPDAAMDLVIANTYIDAIRSLGIRNTWEFLPPQTIMFDLEIKLCCVIYHTPHSMLETIRPDLYHLAFKPLCLANTKAWLASIRSKYENLTTPFGPININWQKLQDESQTEKDKIDGILQQLPPDHLIEVSV